MSLHCHPKSHSSLVQPEREWSVRVFTGLRLFVLEDRGASGDTRCLQELQVLRRFAGQLDPALLPDEISQVAAEELKRRISRSLVEGSDIAGYMRDRFIYLAERLSGSCCPQGLLCEFVRVVDFFVCASKSFTPEHARVMHYLVGGLSRHLSLAVRILVHPAVAALHVRVLDAEREVAV